MSVTVSLSAWQADDLKSYFAYSDNKTPTILHNAISKLDLSKGVTVVLVEGDTR